MLHAGAEVERNSNFAVEIRFWENNMNTTDWRVCWKSRAAIEHFKKSRARCNHDVWLESREEGRMTWDLPRMMRETIRTIKSNEAD